MHLPKLKNAYIEVAVKDETPPEKTECYFTMLIQEDEPVIMGSHLWNFNGKEGWDEDELYVPTNHWLKKQENVYILSPDQLKEIVGEAWEAGFSRGDDQQNVIEPAGNIYPDKQTYINNIFNQTDNGTK